MNPAQRLLATWCKRENPGDRFQRMSMRKLKREMKHRIYRDDEHKKVRASSDAELKLLGVTVAETNLKPEHPAGGRQEATNETVS